MTRVTLAETYLVIAVMFPSPPSLWLGVTCTGHLSRESAHKTEKSSNEKTSATQQQPEHISPEVIWIARSMVVLGGASSRNPAAPNAVDRIPKDRRTSTNGDDAPYQLKRR